VLPIVRQHLRPYGEHYLNTTQNLAEAQNENCFVLNRQKEANKNAMFFVVN